MCGSTCFGRFLAHHQELTTALAASQVLPFERGGSSAAGRGLPDHDQQHCYHHAPTVKREAVNAVVSS
jgi:hypothetical protein